MAEREYAGWLIKKHGLYYRPNWHGYINDAAQAGRYTRTQANREAAIEPESFVIVPAPECDPEKFEAEVRVRERTHD